MISTEVFMDILALHRQGHSMRWIAKKLGIHRNTVKKYITKKKLPQYHQQKRRESILTPFQPMIREWLDQDDYRATWIFDKIKGLGYSGGYDTVRYFVRDVKQKKSRQAYIRFETEPGRQAQMDWADFKIIEPDGKSRFVYLFAMVLGFSRTLFACFVECCDLEAFMDSHIKAFRYLKGVPAEVLYDNMKHVVIRNKAGQVTFNLEFAHFAAHYGFTLVPCPPYSPWVKGKVERPIDYIRERFWRGYLPVDSKEAYLFFQFVSHRYERNSTIITSNKSFGDWQELFGDPVIATAILDRLLHHCKVVNIRGHSYRLKEHTNVKEQLERKENSMQSQSS